MILEYAPDGVIGVLTPQANTTVEPEMALLLPPGLIALTARLTSDTTTIEDRQSAYLDTIDTAMRQFGNAPIRAVAFGTTGTSYLCGREREATLVARLQGEL